MGQDGDPGEEGEPLVSPRPECQVPPSKLDPDRAHILRPLRCSRTPGPPFPSSLTLTAGLGVKQQGGGQGRGPVVWVPCEILRSGFHGVS